MSQEGPLTGALRLLRSDCDWDPRSRTTSCARREVAVGPWRRFALALAVQEFSSDRVGDRTRQTFERPSWYPRAQAFRRSG
jgi:hypothetical protein